FPTEPGPPKIVHATARGAAAVRIDGKLDEPAWAAARPAGDFFRRWPSDGWPAQPTTFKVLYDDEAVYFGIASTLAPGALPRVTARAPRATGAAPSRRSRPPRHRQTPDRAAWRAGAARHDNARLTERGGGNWGAHCNGAGSSGTPNACSMRIIKARRHTIHRD